MSSIASCYSPVKTQATEHGSAGVNLISAVPGVGTAIKGYKIVAVSTKVVSSVIKMKAIKAGISLVIRRMRPLGMHLHHVIPKGVYKENSKIFDQLNNFDVDMIDNLIPLSPSFHSNHPAYRRYVANYLINLAGPTGKLTQQHAVQAINHMESIIQKAHNSGLKLNEFIKTIN